MDNEETFMQVLLSSRSRLALVVAVVLLALVVAAPVSAQDVEPKVVSGDDSKWLVGDAEMFLKFNVKQLMSSGLMKKFGIDAVKEAIKSNEQAKAFIDAAGLDVTKDIDHILISGTGGSGGKDVKALVVVHGKFDTTKIHDELKKQADKGDGHIKLSKEGTTHLYEVEAQGQSMYASFANKNTLVLTQTKDATVDAVKNGGKKAAPISKEMKKALSKFTGKESMAFALLVNDDLKKQVENAPRIGKAAAKLQTLTTSLTITDSIAFNVNGITGEAESAKDLAKALELLKAAGVEMLKGMENLPGVLTDILNAVKIADGKEAVDVNLKISKEMIEKALKAVGGGGGN